MAGYDTSTEVHGIYGRDGESKGVIGKVEDLSCDDQGPQREPEEGGHRGGDGLPEALELGRFGRLPSEDGREVPDAYPGDTCRQDGGRV